MIYSNTSCWVWDIEPGVLHECTEFRTCTWNVSRGALRWNFIGGAIELFWHTHFWNPYQMYIFAVLMRVQSFMSFGAYLGPQKCSLPLRRRRRSGRRRINGAIPIESSHHRCSGPHKCSPSIHLVRVSDRTGFNLISFSLAFICSSHSISWISSLEED